MSMMGELNYFLGLQVRQLPDGIFISQAKYTRDLFKKFGMETSSTATIPMSTSLRLDKDEDGKSVDITKYRGIIGSLLYLTASRPDIMYSVGVCARFQSNPKESHLLAAKRILKYVKGTQELGLWYPRESGFELIGYSDSDLAGCKIDRKSTTGACQFLGSRLISWMSKKQTSVSISTAEAEYIAAGACCAQILWLKHQLEDYNIKISGIPIYCDNTSAISLTQNTTSHSRTKHIEIKHHFIRDHVEKGNVMIEYVHTDNQIADIFTKPLSEVRFSTLRAELGLLNLDT
jgi:hypothetical protein